MDKRTTGIIATVAAVVFCGCPGLFGLCMGATMSLAGFIPGADIDIFGSSDPTSAITTGLISLCVSVLFIAIPIAVWYFTLGKKPASSEVIDSGPIPPAI